MFSLPCAWINGWVNNREAGALRCHRALYDVIVMNFHDYDLFGGLFSKTYCRRTIPDSKVHGANMGPTRVLSAPDGPHVGPMNLAMRDDAATKGDILVSHVESRSLWSLRWDLLMKCRRAFTCFSGGNYISHFNLNKTSVIHCALKSSQEGIQSLRWRHNELHGVSDHQPHDCLLNRLFGRRSKKTSKLRVTGLCARNSPGTGEFSAPKASNAENVSIWWRHHVKPFRY